MAAPLLLRGLPLFRTRFHQQSLSGGLLLRRPWHNTIDSTLSDENSASGGGQGSSGLSAKESAASSKRSEAEYRQWKKTAAEIMRDIQPITLLTKDILHSKRYRDGECLTVEDQHAVEKLLAYHPHSEDKVGSGIDSIMVDRHPQFRQSRCLFVVRTDGGWIDFSYQKCLRAYIREKYPSHGEKFIRENLKRGSG